MQIISLKWGQREASAWGRRTKVAAEEERAGPFPSPPVSEGAELPSDDELGAGKGAIMCQQNQLFTGSLGREMTEPKLPTLGLFFLAPSTAPWRGQHYPVLRAIRKQSGEC